MTETALGAAERRVEQLSARAEHHAGMTRGLVDNVYTFAAVVGVGLLAIAAVGQCRLTLGQTLNPKPQTLNPKPQTLQGSAG